MMKRICAGVLVLGLASSPVLADGKIFVALPDLSSYQGAEAEQFLTALVMANVASSNCPAYAVTDEEWSLLTDAADIIAYGTLKLGVDRYDDDYYRPAFAALKKAETCDEEGPKVQPLLDRLVEHGGSREALPDQDKAYKSWRKLMDRLSAEAEAANAE
jgi:hypothetical protein